MRRRVSDPQAFGKVAVLCGGWSAEREVSLLSGARVFEALDKRGVAAELVDADRETILRLREAGFDRAFNVMHGVGGEDGTVQAALDLQGVPYTGAGVLGSALAMDKLRSKWIWRAIGLPTPDFALAESERDALAAIERLGLPVFVKPGGEGSSVGITKVKSEAEIRDAFRLAARYAGGVLIERDVPGAELTVSILDDTALPSIHIVPAGEFYDYHAKYIAEDTQYHCPSGLPPEQERELARLAMRAFELLCCRGWGRVDFMVEGFPPSPESRVPSPGVFKPWLIEVNTLPGMTTHSLVPMAARAAGMDFAALCWAILETTLVTQSESGA